MANAVQSNNCHCLHKQSLRGVVAVDCFVVHKLSTVVIPKPLELQLD